MSDVVPVLEETCFESLIRKIPVFGKHGLQYAMSLPELQHFFESEPRSASTDSDSTLGARSPKPGHSLEAPARLGTCIRRFRHRALSLSEVDGGEDCFVRLETSFSSLSNLNTSELLMLVNRANNGLQCSVPPILVNGCVGGTYFLRDKSKNIMVVCKPGDEEPNSPNNPHQESLSRDLLKGVVPGFGMYREVAAFLLDEGFAGVPPTFLARVRHPMFSIRGLKMRQQQHYSKSDSCKLSAVQSYVRHEASAEDVSYSRFDIGDVQRVAVMDIRLCNLDRHGGNMLVAKQNPYQRELTPPGPACGVSHTDTPPLPQLHLLGPSLHHLVDHTDMVMSTSAPSTSGEYLTCSSISDDDSAGGGATRLPGGAAASADDISGGGGSRAFRHVQHFGDIDFVNRSSSAILHPSCRLVPIDHCYCLPHISSISSVEFGWLYWPQVQQDISEEIRSYIDNLDYERDVEMLQHVLGAAIADTSLLTLQAGTVFLQMGVKAGLNLFDMGGLMAGSDTGAGDYAVGCVDAAVSPVLAAVQTAVRKTISCMEAALARAKTFNSPPRPSHCKLYRAHSPVPALPAPLQLSPRSLSSESGTSTGSGSVPPQSPVKGRYDFRGASPVPQDSHGHSHGVLSDDMYSLAMHYESGSVLNKELRCALEQVVCLAVKAKHGGAAL